uniref:Uncharacterized protein n=1 Tax=Tetranychus urticae TaxID=32264 RepID=T1JQK7_TETUR
MEGSIRLNQTCEVKFNSSRSKFPFFNMKFSLGMVTGEPDPSLHFNLTRKRSLISSMVKMVPTFSLNDIQRRLQWSMPIFMILILNGHEFDEFEKLKYTNEWRWNQRKD